MGEPHADDVSRGMRLEKDNVATRLCHPEAKTATSSEHEWGA
jgi:hypothetical protein